MTIRARKARKLTRRANRSDYGNSVSPEKKIFRFTEGQIGYIFVQPSPEGRIMIVTIVGTGRGGRW